MNARVRVLLATYNGERWLDDQLRSLFEQQGVSVSVVASDDDSRDSTAERLADWSRRADLQVLPPLHTRMGSANRNFLRLICEAPLGDAEYLAFADQDDIWHADKLARAVECLESSGADAYSSNVTAFWSDGRSRRLVKSQPQRRYDHLFESAGPGCTFVIARRAFESLRSWARERHEQLAELRVHDWLIYAHARTQGWRWTIDNRSTMLYRQHGSNEVGANVGHAARRRRWSQIRSGQYRKDVLEIARAVGDRSPVQSALQRLGWRDRAWLVMHVGQCRRNKVDRMVLALSFLLMPRRKPRRP